MLGHLMLRQDFKSHMMNGDKTTKEWNVRAELFEFYWPQSGQVQKTFVESYGHTKSSL